MSQMSSFEVICCKITSYFFCPHASSLGSNINMTVHRIDQFVVKGADIQYAKNDCHLLYDINGYHYSFNCFFVKFWFV